MKKFKPKALEMYYCICSPGIIEGRTWTDSEIDRYRMQNGNVFKTIKDAKSELVILKNQ